MAEAEFDGDTSPVTQVIAAAFDEWIRAQAHAPALPINDAALGQLATLITSKLVEAGFVDDESRTDDAHQDFPLAGSL